MNKLLIPMSLVSLFSIGEAVAVCDGTGGMVLATNTAALFGNTTICATGNSDQWHEYHATGGVLEKIGDGTAVDPNVPIGSWSTPTNSTVQYTYTGDSGSPYTYTVYVNSTGTAVELCGLIQAIGTLVPGKSGPGC